MRFFKLKEIDSTNVYLKNLKDKRNKDVVLAEKQWAGRGRRGNKWFSNEGAALFSFLIEEDMNISLQDYLKLPIIIGFSVYESLKILEKEYDFKFKWTNDIYLNEKKISGILIERIENFFVIGVGVNLNNKIDKEIEKIAISLKEVSKKEYDIDNFVKNVIDISFKNIEKLKDKKWNDILEKINKINYLFGKRIKITGIKEENSGLAGSILEDGTLEVFVGNKIKKFNIGEIHIEKIKEKDE